MMGFLLFKDAVSHKPLFYFINDHTTNIKAFFSVIP